MDGGMIERRAADAFAGWPPPVLDPAGPFAGPVTVLSWVLFVGGLAILLLVLAALLAALSGRGRLREALGRERMVWLGGLAFPVVVLSALLIYGLSLTSRLTEAPTGEEMRIRVSGEMWWWRVSYLDAAGREVLQDANELHIPVGRPVVLELESPDVIHSFWVPRLSGKLDMIPGRRNLLRIQADEVGVYGGQCAEYCGGPHAFMGFQVVALEPSAFAVWKARQAAVPTAVTDPAFARGREVFDASGCGACHTIRATAANGLAGPDLTHVGARRGLGAGVLANGREPLKRWIRDNQTLKPGNRMPAYDMLSERDLDDVAAWLEALK